MSVFLVEFLAQLQALFMLVLVLLVKVLLVESVYLLDLDLVPSQTVLVSLSVLVMLLVSVLVVNYPYLVVLVPLAVKFLSAVVLVLQELVVL
tara:strand:+ start:324 stop:599 length:276 start_codon:yes stop_codon:yes gene_type:complete